MKKFKIIFTGNSCYSNCSEAFTLYEKSWFGEKKEGKIIYSIFETLYLLEKEKIELIFENKKINFENFFSIISKKDKKIPIKYIVFKDLRSKGYVVKTALKFGAEFRVYEKGTKPHKNKEHAKWILYPLKESDKITMQELSAKSRIAHSTKKNLLIAVVDEEEDVTYYEVSWIKI
ncbi:MAG: tRNA-intron lyase [Candidatus Pacearchaeota archaeon]